jgi:hypothetical protein
MPKSALSERLLDANNWKGTDDDVWYMRWRIGLKYMYAYGPRATEWWAKWREWPKTILAVRSKQGVFRMESETWERDSAIEGAYEERVIENENMYMFKDIPELPGVVDVSRAYLSRIQYYTRWHFQIQWPFMVAFHFYFKAADVPEWGKPRPDTDGKLFYCYFGAHRDADKVYWFPSAFVGLVWK